MLTRLKELKEFLVNKRINVAFARVGYSCVHTITDSSCAVTKTIPYRVLGSHVRKVVAVRFL